jgi:hypothetical protein
MQDEKRPSYNVALLALEVDLGRVEAVSPNLALLNSQDKLVV